MLYMYLESVKRLVLFERRQKRERCVQHVGLPVGS